jgi:hypothetical protein
MPGRAGTPRLELWIYLGAAITYIATGFVAKEVFAWWSYGALWLVAPVWFIPAAIRKFRNKDIGTDRNDGE